MKKLLYRIAMSFGYGILNRERVDQLNNIEYQYNSVKDMIPDGKELFNLVAKATGIGDHSKSQFGQDIFVLLETSFKNGGYFVEFGAANGVDLSNTYLLEKRFGWKGILAEPARVWHEDLRRHRDAVVDHDCVWRESGQKLNFTMADQAGLSTISQFWECDHHHDRRESGVSYEVSTISLQDLLIRHNAPRKIDYLSIDTEGSEYEILRGFDFDAYDISIITCEHNFTNERVKIHELLTGKGYVRKFTGLSCCDDWYVKKSEQEG